MLDLEMGIRDVVRRALPFVCKDETRDHMSFVRLVQIEDNLWAEATNGHCLARFVSRKNQECEGSPLPRGGVGLLERDAKDLAALRDDVSYSYEDGKLYLTSGGGRVLCFSTVPADRFPPCHQVVPSRDARTPGATVGISPKYLRLVADAFKGMSCRMHLGADIDPVLFTGGGGEPLSEVVVMPCRV